MKKILLLFGLMFMITSIGYSQDLDSLESLSDDAVTEESSEDLSGLSDDDSLSDLSSLSDDDDSLSDLSETEAESDLGGDMEEMESESDDEEDDEPTVTINFNGYVKPLIYWQQSKYSDSTWSTFKALSGSADNVPKDQDERKFTDTGIRTQLKLEGYLEDKARLFTAVNVNYNESAEDDADKTEVRVIEAYIELFGEGQTWKIGNQLATWGFMEGVDVPTDRLNARDYDFDTMEFEDGKLASTGVLYKQSLDAFSFWELIYIPVARVDKNASESGLFYQAEDEYADSYYGKSKYAARLFLNFGNLDTALSYVDGLDPLSDVYIDSSGDAGRSYHRVQSLGLDLQYNFGSFLAKVAAVSYKTEDEGGDDPYIKNSWHKILAGVEFMTGSVTTNVYVGQTSILDYQDDTVLDQQTNALMGQAEESQQFVSGHINSSFLTGNALDMTIMFAQYWDDEGEAIKKLLTGTFTYKLSDGLEIALSPGYIYNYETEIYSAKSEITYSF